MSGSSDGFSGAMGFGKGMGHKPVPSDLALKRELQLLRGLVEALLLASARGESINLENPDIRLLLGLAEDAGSEEILRRLMNVRSPVTGRVDCPHCGGALQQREGVESVECHWCGKTVEFELAQSPTQG